MESLRNIPIHRQVPVYRFLVSYVAGLTAQGNIQIHPFVFGIGLAVAVLSVTVAEFFLRKKVRWIRNCQGGALLVSFFFLGCAAKYASDPVNRKDWLRNNYVPGAPVVVELLERPYRPKGTAYCKAMSRAVWLSRTKELKTVSGKLSLYFKESDKNAQGFSAGQKLLLNTTLTPISGSLNPGEHDYPKYCLLKGIAFQCFLSGSDYVAIGRPETNTLDNAIDRLRNAVVSTLRRYIVGSREQGVAEALLIGYRDDLDKSLLKQYAETGTVHVIAISGMHLGMIYGLLTWMLSFIKQGRAVEALKPLFLLGVLWLFSLLAGAGASIVRSAVMYSFIVFGSIVKRRGSLFNNLAVSAFLLLVYDPSLLWDLGFQLSYAAIIGIGCYSQLFLRATMLSNPILRAVASMLAVSLSAQIFTLPIIINNFQRIPTLFLFTNLVIVPLSALAIYLELFMLAFSFVPFLASVFGRTAGWAIAVMNAYTSQTASLPFASLEGFDFSVLQTFAFGSAVFFLLRYWKDRSKIYALAIGLFSATVLVGENAFKRIAAKGQRTLIVCKINGMTAVETIEGELAQLVLEAKQTKASQLAKAKEVLFAAQRCYGIRTVTKAFQVKEGVYFRTINGKNILVISGPVQFGRSQTFPKIDFLVLSAHIDTDIKSLVRSCRPSVVIADSSVKKKNLARWRKALQELGAAFYEVNNAGAFIVSL